MIIGHERIWNFLLKSAQNNRLAHAYLFIGAEGLGKKKVAVEFAKSLECQKQSLSKGESAFGDECPDCLLIERNQHPDVLIIDTEKENTGTGEPGKPRKAREIKIEEIRALQHQINLSPYSGKRKIVIIDSAERLTAEAANCLLKTLEEPPQKSVIFLISSAWQRILPTIISRCQLIKFLPVKGEKILAGLDKTGAFNKAKIPQAVRFACGRPGVALTILKEPQFLLKNNQLIEELEGLVKKNLTERFQYAKDMANDAIAAEKTLGQWIIWFRDELLIQTGNNNLAILNRKSSITGLSQKKIIETIKNIEQSQRLMMDSSFNSRLILENLMLKL
jgi:DNA polymerase-3 subunit delta'